MTVKEAASVLYQLADTVRAHERIMQLPDCNTCKRNDCKHRPKPGDMVRINCFDYTGGGCEMTREETSFYNKLLPFVARKSYENGKYDSIIEILEIIDEKHDDFRDGSFRDDSITYAQAWKRSNEAIREAVEGLRGEK